LRDFWLEIHSIAQIDLITVTMADGEREKEEYPGQWIRERLIDTTG
jgi:hypothetical protein